MSTTEELGKYRTNSDIFKQNPIEIALKIPFINGIYKGQSLESILKANPGYLLYLIRCNFGKEIPSYPGVEKLINSYFELAVMQSINTYKNYIENLEIALNHFYETGEAIYVSF